VAGWDALVAHGIRTVLDLRTTAERDALAVPEGLGDLRFVHVSVFYEDDPVWMEQMSETTGRIREHYGHLLARPERFARAISAVASAPTGGVCVHCHAGRDRTGLLVAMMLELVGVPRDVIAHDYSLSESRLDDVFETKPETIIWALDLLDRRFGGVRGYLRDGGTTDIDLAAVEARLLAD
jgi:hypothetical protein